MSTHVLLVEDNTAFAYLAEKALSRAGYRVAKARSAFEALGALRSGHVDLLLSDVKLPDCNGFALARMARERQPGLKVLFMTAAPELASGEIADRVDRVLAKPNDAGRIVSEVSAALAA
jgi:two-component system cell cycle response regulator CpdR